MYHLWGFLNTIFNTSEHIVALGKEKSSAANSSETNNKRKISAVDPVENKKMGLETDTVYIGDDDVEFGLFGNRKGKRPNQGIQRWISLPIVMRDMIMKLIGENPSLVNKLHILGYSIIGNKISLLDMDIPKGYVMRIRRSKQVGYPDSKDNFIVRMAPLLQLAIIGKEIAETTYNIFSNDEIPLEEGDNEGLVIPPRIYISPSTSSSETSTSTASSNKRQITGNSDNSVV
ncbi:hypothetical protein BDA99DRAFT_556980 [Phascolomyces articulosus]|uniref:Uncharacterized protein n=1 Tax=Phascolomyces articulosus TaxID=60185 RepID=A0AAD5PH44_9FUNG|nr:hypothetical protein BDA99DRAFT_556980 [Phascolomyces articulosus]